MISKLQLQENIKISCLVWFDHFNFEWIGIWYWSRVGKLRNTSNILVFWTRASVYSPGGLDPQFARMNRVISVNVSSTSDGKFARFRRVRCICLERFFQLPYGEIQDFNPCLTTTVKRFVLTSFLWVGNIGSIKVRGYFGFWGRWGGGKCAWLIT